MGPAVSAKVGPVVGTKVVAMVGPVGPAVGAKVGPVGMNVTPARNLSFGIAHQLR